VVLIEVTSNVGIGVFDAPSVVVSVFRESGELAVKVAVFTLAVTRNAGVKCNTVCWASVACEPAEFSVWNSTFTAGCSGVVEIVVATPGLTVWG
jgi:hypothetical protein